MYNVLWSLEEHQPHHSEQYAFRTLRLEDPKSRSCSTGIKHKDWLVIAQHRLTSMLLDLRRTSHCAGWADSSCSGLSTVSTATSLAFVGESPTVASISLPPAEGACSSAGGVQAGMLKSKGQLEGHLSDQNSKVGVP